jgi:hypothetical protein
VVFGFDYALLGLERTAQGPKLFYAVNRAANRPGARESVAAEIDCKEAPVYLRVSVGPGAICRFSYSFDQRVFTPIGAPFQASGDRWIGAKVGLVASAAPSASTAGHADFEWFHMTPTTP